MSRTTDAAEVQRSFGALVRALGLARPDTTPCGMPMSITEAHAIGTLHDEGPVTQSRLAASLRLEKSTVSRLVDQLEKAGVVRRTAHPTDRRSVMVELTPTGRRRAERLDRARHELFTQLVAGLAATERRQIVQALAALEEASRALP
jgi:DNA-binding MarR family transcriptional regulator